ncbi:hypothetical protein CAPTEDRAFT_224318 [Capitella teleta]|uniref:Uncharacterized protein n=1 Tax=Capitella teleta TaxID=283909 RepID=R7V4V3_CAPTE|nr:hypothetical protein CAPTEDRAFT_224318 [Capitella teleta]|eukprot:ELU13883.1 hypothetical protein CAPTEDRAFT_224318 [Capitella teleta]
MGIPQDHSFLTTRRFVEAVGPLDTPQYPEMLEVHHHLLRREHQLLHTVNAASTSASVEDLAPDESPAEKFERELNWCIEQLEHGLLGANDPATRQVQEAGRVLKILRSTKAPLPRKRQVMSNTFGDYRKKMQQETTQQNAKLKQIKFRPVSKRKIKNSTFYKSSVNKTSAATSGFKFNFPNADMEADPSASSIPVTTDPAKDCSAPEPCKQFIMKPSDNSFRFNFSDPSS